MFFPQTHEKDTPVFLTTTFPHPSSEIALYGAVMVVTRGRGVQIQNSNRNQPAVYVRLRLSDVQTAD